MIDKLKDFIVVTGHYGCGKTNFTINLAFDYVKAGRKVTVVDMDLINPYFRTSDFKQILEEKGIEVITPVFGATNLDIPSLPTAMYGIFEKKDVVIVDVGGDDAGATVLGRFRPQFETVDYDMLYVVNRFRSMSTDLDEAVEVLGEIEAVSGLKPTYIVNNSHMMYDTNQAVFDEGVAFADSVAKKTSLPVICNTVQRDLYDTGMIMTGNCNHDRSEGSFVETYPVDIYVKTVWQNTKFDNKIGSV